MRFQITDVPPDLAPQARPAGEARVQKRLPHGALAAAVASLVDFCLRQIADIRSATEELAKMPFLVTPGGDFDRALGGGVGIDHARCFKGIDHAKWSIEPAGEILAFEMRAGEQFRSRFAACAQHVTNAVDFGGEAGLGQSLSQPLQRAHVRFGKGRPVDAGSVRADGA